MKDKKVTTESSIDIKNLSEYQFNIILSGLELYIMTILKQIQVHSNDYKKFALEERKEAYIVKEMLEATMDIYSEVLDLFTLLESE
ncbi:MAG: hypothetical protein ACOCRX_03450 [Candidatus Woesearchaeota archaeon]